MFATILNNVFPSIHACTTFLLTTTATSATQASNELLKLGFVTSSLKKFLADTTILIAPSNVKLNYSDTRDQLDLTAALVTF